MFSYHVLYSSSVYIIMFNVCKTTSLVLFLPAAVCSPFSSRSSSSAPMKQRPQSKSSKCFCFALLKGAVCKCLTLLKHTNTICLQIFKKLAKLTYLFYLSQLFSFENVRPGMSVCVLICETRPLPVYPIVFRHPGTHSVFHFIHCHVCAFLLVSSVWQPASEEKKN